MLPSNRREIVRWLLKTSFFLVVAAAGLFLPAGSTSWGAGRAYFGMVAAVQLLNALVLIPLSPELIVERSQVQAGTKHWDTPLVMWVAVIGPLSTWVVSGLDHRFGWSGGLLPALQWLFLAIAFLGGLITLWAMACNRFFSGTVRIQAERGHSVVSAGPYRFLRHPGYAGGLLFNLASPPALGSWWAFLPVAITVGVLFLRTALEDRMLMSELEGYREYARRVRFRLAPGIW